MVVFHRISDNMQHSNVKCTFMTMANHSMNQVFIRSINTTLTSIIPVFAMLLFGSETLKDFAFAMVIGLLAGAYSSIAIACPLFAMWKTHEPKFKKLEKKYGTQVGRFAFAHGSIAATPVAAEAPAVAADAAAPAVEPASAAHTATEKPKGASAGHGAVLTGAQKAKAQRAAQRKKKAGRPAKAQQAALDEPEIRIVDKEKFDKQGGKGEPGGESK